MHTYMYVCNILYAYDDKMILYACMHACMKVENKSEIWEGNT